MSLASGGKLVSIGTYSGNIYNKFFGAGSYSVELAGYTLTSYGMADGKYELELMYVYHDSVIYTLTDAYALGLVSADEVYELGLMMDWGSNISGNQPYERSRDVYPAPIH